MFYVPPVFRNLQVPVLHRFIRQFNFATVITQSQKGPWISHLPLILRPSPAPYGTLIGHMAKANPQWKAFDGKQLVTCVFHGPHAYTSPTWYKRKPEVPTWNYAVVHAEGAPTQIHDATKLKEMSDELLSLYEPDLDNPKSPHYISREYRDSQLPFIVGFELVISKLTGKFKLGQNRTEEDQLGIVEGLSHGSEDSRNLAEFIKQLRKS